MAAHRRLGNHIRLSFALHLHLLVFQHPGNTAFPNINGPFRRLHGIEKTAWFDTSVFSARRLDSRRVM